MTNLYQNAEHNLTVRIILSAAFDPNRPDVADDFINQSLAPSEQWRARQYTPTSSISGGLEEAPNFFQDEVPWEIRRKTLGGATIFSKSPAVSDKNTTNTDYTNDKRNTNELTVANEFELDVSNITHTFQSLTAVGPLPGMPRRHMEDVKDTAQLTALAIDLGMIREIISVQGVLIDRPNHPNSESGHHVRRQHLLDLLRTQYAFVHGINRTRKDPWQNINRFPALTIGAMTNRTAETIGDRAYEGDQPSNDPRGIARKGAANSAQVADAAARNLTVPKYSWVPKPTYSGRNRYRGLMRRLTVKNEGGRPDVWNYSFEFVVIKNEMQQRVI
tara:strand:- start:2104 stop:3096 length:993 start_codon:yes stop_codon:yes gene_type:complete